MKSKRGVMSFLDHPDAQLHSLTRDSVNIWEIVGVSTQRHERSKVNPNFIGLARGLSIYL